MWLGLLGVAVTSLCYGAGTVMQALAARRQPSGTGVDPALLVRLLRDPVYLASLLLELVGFAASVVALRTLPLFLVESAVASSVGVTAVLAVRFLGARLRVPELMALAGLGIGLVLLAVSAQPGAGRQLPASGSWALLAAVAVVLLLGLGAANLRKPWGSVALAAAAGAAFGGLGVAARVIVLDGSLLSLLGDPLAWALLGYGVLGMVFFALAVQRGAVTTAAAVTFCVETLLPAALGLAFLGDAARAGFVPVAVLAFALTLGCAVLLARFAEPEPGISRAGDPADRSVSAPEPLDVERPEGVS